MRKVGLIFLALLINHLSFSQQVIQDGNVETRDVKGFHGIKVATGIQLYLTQGTTEAVAVSAANIEDRDRIKTEVRNGVLKIYYDYNFWRLLKSHNRKLKAYVSIVDIDMLDLSSGAYVKVDGALKSNQLNFDASSGAVFKGQVDVGDLDVDQSSGSVVTMTGVVGKLRVDGSSGSVFHGYELQVENCFADVSSGAGAQVTIKKELSAEASSGGYVSYKGEGVIRNLRTSSGGSVRKK